MRNSSSSHPSRWHTISQISGGILLGIGIFWLAKLLFFHAPAAAPLMPATGAGARPTVSAADGGHGSSSPLTFSTPAPLRAAGITVSAIQPPATMSEAQALLLAGQDEPDAASSAKKQVADAVSLSYPASKVVKGHADFNHSIAWMVWYQQVPQGGNGIAIDKQPNHDFYIFLDAKTGQELFTIWS
jgi:hypothetical protein